MLTICGIQQQMLLKDINIICILKGKIFVHNKLKSYKALLKSSETSILYFIMVIELSGVQFRSEIILVISNRTRAARSFDFEITRMISDQIALHSVQLPL